MQWPIARNHTAFLLMVSRTRPKRAPLQPICFALSILGIGGPNESRGRRWETQQSVYTQSDVDSHADGLGPHLAVLGVACQRGHSWMGRLASSLRELLPL